MVVDFHAINPLLPHLVNRFFSPPPLQKLTVLDEPDSSLGGKLYDHLTRLEITFFAHVEIRSVIGEEVEPETFGRVEIVMSDEEPACLHGAINFCFGLPKILRKLLAEENMDVDGIQQILISERLESEGSPLEHGPVGVGTSHGSESSLEAFLVPILQGLSARAPEGFGLKVKKEDPMEEGFDPLLPARREVPHTESRLPSDRQIVPGVGCRLLHKRHALLKGVSHEPKPSLCVYPVDHLLGRRILLRNPGFQIKGEIMVVPQTDLMPYKHQNLAIEALLFKVKDIGHVGMVVNADEIKPHLGSVLRDLRDTFTPIRVSGMNVNVPYTFDVEHDEDFVLSLS
jgi:hypothetical protein